MEPKNTLDHLRGITAIILEFNIYTFSLHGLEIIVEPKVDYMGVHKGSNKISVGTSFYHPALDFFEIRRLKRFYRNYIKAYPQIAGKIRNEDFLDVNGIKKVLWFAFHTTDDIDMQVLGLVIPNSNIVVQENNNLGAWVGKREYYKSQPA